MIAFLLVVIIVALVAPQVVLGTFKLAVVLIVVAAVIALGFMMIDDFDWGWALALIAVILILIGIYAEHF